MCHGGYSTVKVSTKIWRFFKFDHSVCSIYYMHAYIHMHRCKHTCIKGVASFSDICEATHWIYSCADIPAFCMSWCYLPNALR